MASIKIIATAAAVISMLMVAAKAGEKEVTCAAVDATLAPCLTYLKNGGDPGAACCKGVVQLQVITPTTQDRRAACQCIKDAAARNKNINDEAAEELPAKCNIAVKIPISKDVDCTTIE